MRFRSILLPAFLLVSASSFAQFQINIIPGSGLAANAAALAAFNRAAAQWTSRFNDNIVVNINADLAFLGAGILGGTSPTQTTVAFDTIRNAMVTDGTKTPGYDILNSLPTRANFNFVAPTGSTVGTSIQLTTANYKALGFTSTATSDATIQFTTNTNTTTFDYDNRNGLNPNQTDFETVAAHEIGHALGFISNVDNFDRGLTTTNVEPLDLFRFSTGNLPTTATEFASKPRELRPGSAASFSDATNAYGMSTGQNRGDGRQASHWIDTNFAAQSVGIMDPTLADGVIGNITAADIRAFDLIGYDYIQAVPEPSTLAVFALGGLAVLRRRKK